MLRVVLAHLFLTAFLVSLLLTVQAAQRLAAALPRRDRRRRQLLVAVDRRAPVH